MATRKLRFERVMARHDKDNTIAKIKMTTGRVLIYILLAFLTIMCLFFFYLLFINATKNTAEIEGNFSFLPSIHLFENINKLFTDFKQVADISNGLLNSFIIAALTAILTTYFSALTAYALHAYDFKGKKAVETFILLIMMVPSQLTSVGFIQLAYNMDLTNKMFMLIVPAIASPAVFFYMIQYLRATLPRDLIEASRVDGSSEFGTFNRVVIPIMKPAIAVQLIFSFVQAWNNLYLPSLLLTDKSKFTLPIILSFIRNANPQDLESMGGQGVLYTAILFSVLPVIVVFIFLSKSIIKGVTAGSVKG